MIKKNCQWEQVAKLVKIFSWWNFLHNIIYGTTSYCFFEQVAQSAATRDCPWSWITSVSAVPCWSGLRHFGGQQHVVVKGHLSTWSPVTWSSGVAHARVDPRASLLLDLYQQHRRCMTSTTKLFGADCVQVNSSSDTHLLQSDIKNGSCPSISVELMENN